MKKHIAALTVLVGILSLQSCNEDINLIGDFQETAVIYGLLDQSDSIHMIKINRAFIGPGNATHIGGSLGRTWILSDTVVSGKDPNGIFYAPDQIVYYFETTPTNPLIPNGTYKLHVNINNGEFEVTGETELVDGIASSNAAIQNYAFKFASNPAEYISSAVNVSTGNSFQLNTRLKIDYAEYVGTAGIIKSIDWNLGESEVNPNSSKTFTANGETFYNLVENACSGQDPLIDRRQFIGVTITMTGAAEDFYNYILVNEPSSSLAQSKPTYTNLVTSEDHRVIGIFSSRQTVSIYKPFYVSSAQAYIRAIDKKSTQELCQGPITGPYLFCSNHPGDNIVGLEESYACP
jgi:hypothetical protein